MNINQIAHDLAVAKLCAELPGNLDNPHICQRYFKYRAEFADLLDSHDEDYFLNELDKEKVKNFKAVKQPSVEN